MILSERETERLGMRYCKQRGVGWRGEGGRGREAEPERRKSYRWEKIIKEMEL